MHENLLKLYKELSDLYKAIFHLNDEGRTEGTLRNIENLLKDLGEENVKVELVVHSEGVYSFLKDRNELNKKATTLLEKGIKIGLCSNTIEKLHLKLDSFIPGVEIVSSAVGEIVRKEKDGWVYIKP